jgi:hypothetical protein
MTDYSPESFADHPESIQELRSDRTQNAADWSPRDALIAMLRKIDRGEIDSDALVVVWRQRKGEGVAESGFAVASPDVHVTLGLLVHAQHKVMGLP